MSTPLSQLDAELSHVLTAILHELEGIAHNHMSCDEMNLVIDNMISKGGLPRSPSVHLTRWMHIHSHDANYKVHQIREALMTKSLQAVVPDCFGLFYDKTAPECRICADKAKCVKAAEANPNINKSLTTDARVDHAYPVGKGGVDRAAIQEVLESKLGQITKNLARGIKVVLITDQNNMLRVLTPAPQSPEEDTMTKKPDTKSKKAAAQDEDDEEEVVVKATAKKGAKAAPVIDEDDDDEEEAPVVKKGKKAAPVVEDDEDDEEEAPKPKAKKAKPAPAEEEDDDEEEEAPKGKFKPVETKKAKKEAKPKPELNKAQTEFAAKLKTDYKEDKALFKFAKELGVTWEKKEDARINRMKCVMAVKAHLGTVGKKK